MQDAAHLCITYEAEAGYLRLAQALDGLGSLADAAHGTQGGLCGVEPAGLGSLLGILADELSRLNEGLRKAA